ncbi:MAG TPA: hypothetical protein VND94_16025 [Terriglobia bacterium]|nr:hypothetical protein [Terriglobia bacterium]
MRNTFSYRDDGELDACIAATLSSCRKIGCVEDELALALLEALGHLVLQCQERSGTEAFRLTNGLRQGVAAHMARKLSRTRGLDVAGPATDLILIEVDENLVMEACGAWRELITIVLLPDDDETPLLLAEKLLSLVLTIDPDWLDTAIAMEIVAAARAADEDWLDNGGEAAEVVVSVN